DRTHVVTAAQVLREPGVVPPEPTQVHELCDPSTRRRVPERGGPSPVTFCELSSRAHRVHEVVRRVHVAQRLQDRRPISDVTRDHLDTIAPPTALQLRRRPRQTTHPEPSPKEL